MTLDIIGPGFGRTGTMSCKAAVEQLGFGPCYHMSEVYERSHEDAWWVWGRLNASLAMPRT